MTDAYIVGVDMIKLGRFPDKTVRNLELRRFDGP